MLLIGFILRCSALTSAIGLLSNVDVTLILAVWSNWLEKTGAATDEATSERPTFDISDMALDSSLVIALMPPGTTRESGDAGFSKAAAALGSLADPTEMCYALKD